MKIGMSMEGIALQRHTHTQTHPHTPTHVSTHACAHTNACRLGELLRKEGNTLQGKDLHIIFFSRYTWTSPAKPQVLPWLRCQDSSSKTGVPIAPGALRESGLCALGALSEAPDREQALLLTFDIFFPSSWHFPSFSGCSSFFLQVN